MIYLATGLILLTIGFNLWTLIELAQSKRSKKSLFFIIPVALFLAISSVFIINEYVGYPTDSLSKLERKEWRLIAHHIDFERKVVYILVIHAEESEPRLYKITTNFDENKDAVQKAQKAAQKGMPVRGKMSRSREGDTENKGDLIFYTLPPSAVMPKDNP